MNSKFLLVCLHESIRLKSQYTFCKRCGVIMRENEVITLKVAQANCPAEINPFDLIDNMQKDCFDFKRYKNLLKHDAWAALIKERAETLKTLKLYITLCKYSEKTLYLSSLYLDIIALKLRLNKAKINYDKNLLILGCMIIASKFIENDFDPNLLETQKWHFSFYSLESILRYEELCLRLLEHKLNYTTAYDFARLFLNHGIVLVEENPPVKLESINQKVMDTLSSFLTNEKFLEYDTIQIACACVYLTREFFKFLNWEQTFFLFYGINSDSLKECANTILSPETCSTIYLKKKFLTDTKMKISNFDSYLTQPLVKASEFDSFLNESKNKVSNFNFRDKSDLITLENSMRRSCQITSFKIPAKSSFINDNEKIKNNVNIVRESYENIFDPEESTNGANIPEQKIYFKQRKKLDSSPNQKNTIYFGKNSTYHSEKKNVLDKVKIERNIKNNSDLLTVQSQRFQSNKKNNTLNELNMPCFLETDNNQQAIYVNKVISNASTASNSIKSENRNQIATESKYINSKEKLGKDTKREINFSNKIEKIKNALSNKHNFSFRQLNSLDFDINKVLEKNKKPELKILSDVEKIDINF